MSSIDFDEASHVYRLEGKEIPSVTTFLKDAGFCSPSRFYTTEKRDLGTIVHQYTALYDQGFLTIDEIDPELRGYLTAWKEFRENTSFVARGIETIVWSKSLWLAGTVDRFGTIGQQEAIIDIKTGKKAAWHKYQLAAYNLIRESEALRVNVYLTAEGKYSVQTWGDATDYATVLRALESRKPA